VPAAFELAMFPLSTVIFPHQRVPLHVFEPRYRQLVDDVRARDGRFGICLIAKGCEVGGGDERVDVGTIVQLQTVFPFSDGRCMVVVDGVERIKVDSWLVDDPYPRAIVEIDPGADSPSEGGLLAETEASVRSLRRLHSEMNPDSCVDVGCAMEDESCVRAWQLCALTPMATLDQLKLLREDRCDERLRLLGEICCERYGDLMRQLELDATD
jgi:Lon protease-like protein